MKKEIKTNAMRLLDQAKIEYETLYYDLGYETFSGDLVCEKLNVNPDICLKTLVLKHDKDLYVVAIAVNKNLNLKKTAKAFGVKSLGMVKVKDLLKEVGYQRGSVTPIGILKKHKVAFDISINDFDTLIISGGQKGISLKLDKNELINYLNAEVLDICED